LIHILSFARNQALWRQALEAPVMGLNTTDRSFLKDALSVRLRLASLRQGFTEAGKPLNPE
jgi:hypothetical protein